MPNCLATTNTQHVLLAWPIQKHAVIVMEEYDFRGNEEP
jgi:hypothetical protein